MEDYPQPHEIFRSTGQRLFGADGGGALFAQEDLDLLFNGEEYAPAPLSKEEKAALKAAEQFEDFSEAALYECPQWLFEKSATHACLTR